MKKLIAILLAICVMFTAAAPVFAAGDLNQQEAQLNLSDHSKWQIRKMLPELKLSQAKEMTLDELRYAADIASTDEEASIVFDALLDKYQSDVSLQSSSIVTEYVSVTNITKSGKSTIVKYKIKKTIPSQVSINLGYEFPASTRTQGQNISLTGKTSGNYTKTFTIPALMCQHRIFSQLTARNYSEKHVWKLYHFSCAKSVDYHTVTAAEVVGYFAVYEIAPGLAAEISLFSKSINIVGKVVTIGGFATTVMAAFNANVGIPKPVVGQYYKTETWYEMDKMYYRITVWQDKNTYLNNPSVKLYASPAGYATTNLPKF